MEVNILPHPMDPSWELSAAAAPDSCLPPQSYGSAGPSYRSEEGLETTDSASKS